MKHNIRTVLLLTSLAALFMGIGSLIGGQSGMITALGFSFLMNLFSTHPPVKERIRRLLSQKVASCEKSRVRA